MNNNLSESKIAVLIPCYNEELTISKVIEDFKIHLKGVDIYVFDNNSTDETNKNASKAGAIVILSARRGKGNVVRHMLDIIDADIYVMVDGDYTYPASSVGEMLSEMVSGNYDMVVGKRVPSNEGKPFRRLHKLGNKFISKLISILFSANVTDAMSGYRILSRNFVRGIYLKSEGFEVETELTLQALIRKFLIKEISVSYYARPKGSISKLSTFHDGIQILKTIVLIFKDYKPFLFFSIISVISLVLGLSAGWLPISDYISDRYVHHVPLAILATGLVILSIVLWGVGVILHTITNFHIENQKSIIKYIDGAIKERKK